MTDDVEEFDDVTCESATTKAILVVMESGAKHWIPKKLIHDDSEVWGAGSGECGPGTLIVARWFAEKEGLE